MILAVAAASQRSLRAAASLPPASSLSAPSSSFSSDSQTFADALHRHPPFIFEPGLSVPWPEAHTFRMAKFSDLAAALLAPDGLIF